MGSICSFYATKKSGINPNDFAPLSEYDSNHGIQFPKGSYDLPYIESWWQHPRREPDEIIHIPYKYLSRNLSSIFKELFDLPINIDIQSLFIVLNSFQMMLLIDSIIEHLMNEEEEKRYSFEKNEFIQYKKLIEQENEKMCYIYYFD